MRALAALGAMTEARHLQKLSAGGVPDADGLVLRARDHQLQIRTQAHGAHGGLMPLQTVQRLPRHHVPEAHRLIQRSRYDGVRVGGQRCAEYSPCGGQWGREWGGMASLVSA